uniref:Homeobox domain-containing protein n=1 Tax=Strongyloides papillosus TaxID=174720 RepID=A0A0N5BDQ8_STREA
MSLMYDKQVKFTNIMGQGRINQLGGMFINGRPLPTHVRLKIIELAKNGVKPCHISRQLKVSHGAVSKILNRFAETGSVSPGQVGGSSKSRIATQCIEKDVASIMEINPDYNANDIRMELIANKICTNENAPSLTSIKKLIKSIEFRRENNSCSVNSENNKISLTNELPFSIDKILSVNTTSGDSRKRNHDLAVSEKSPTGSGEGKRNRTSFTAQQLKALENLFLINTYPDSDEREKLSKITNLSEEKIMTWFSNRRARCRKNLSFSSSDQHDYIISPILSSTNNGISSITSSAMTPLSITTTNNCTSYFGATPTPPSSHFVGTPYFHMGQNQGKFFQDTLLPFMTIPNINLQHYNSVAL